MEHVEPFTFNAVRFALGSLALVPVLVFRRKGSGSFSPDNRTKGLRAVLFSGIAAGAVLFAGASFQQIGIVHTTAGKAGFITGLYIIIVPALGLFRKRKPGLTIWLGALIAVSGLHLLCFSGRFSIASGDLLVLISAFFWALHVILIGIFSPRMDSYTLACLQFAVCSGLSFGSALLTEEPEIAGITAAMIPILYAGLLSSGVAYTLQVVAQKNVKPDRAAIIMSLEAVFAVLGGWVVLGESLTLKGVAGCGLMLAGMLISQSDPGKP